MHRLVWYCFTMNSDIGTASEPWTISIIDASTMSALQPITCSSPYPELLRTILMTQGGTHTNEVGQGGIDRAATMQRALPITAAIEPEMLLRLEEAHLWKYELPTSTS